MQGRDGVHPSVAAGAVLAGELAGTAYAPNPDSDVPSPSAPALRFPSDNTGGKPHWAFQISVLKPRKENGAEATRAEPLGRRGLEQKPHSSERCPNNLLQSPLLRAFAPFA